MTISVIIATFNSQKTLARCLDSVIGQQAADFEVCIMDNVSSDKTIEIIEEYSQRYGNIRYVSEPDQCRYDAMNKGIRLAKGDWLYFLGSDDDLYDPYVFRDIFRKPFPDEVGLVYGNVYVAGDTAWAKDGDIYDRKFWPGKLFLKNICHQGIFYRRDLFAKLGTYNLDFPNCADWDMNLRFFAYSRTQYIDRIIARFHASPNSCFESDSIKEKMIHLGFRYFGKKVVPLLLIISGLRRIRHGIMRIVRPTK